MTRAITVGFFLAAVAIMSSVAEAQWSYFSPYAGCGCCGSYGYGGYGFGGFCAGYGYYPCVGYGYPYGVYGSFNYSQQLSRQQAFPTQLSFQQQQQPIINQIQQAQSQPESLDARKQRLVRQYRNMSDSNKAAVRAGLMADYLNLDAHGKDDWKQDAVIQIIIGKDLLRLDEVAQFRDMSESDKTQFRSATLQKYRSLPSLRCNSRCRKIRLSESSWETTGGGNDPCIAETCDGRLHVVNFEPARSA